jgi:peptidoglycan/LPS O-acetylase OafA/YrhL
LSGFYFGAFQFESSFYNFLPDIKIYGIEIFEKKTFYNTVAAIFITASIINGFGQNLLESKPVQFLGRISFPLYLLHMIILGSVTCIFYLALPQTKATLAACFASYISISILASYLFERFIDKPSIYISHRFSYFMTRETL